MTVAAPDRQRGKAERKAENRRLHHEQAIDAAPTERRRFWAACGWLLSEADKAGELDAATEMVLNRVHEIREGAIDAAWNTPNHRHEGS